MRTTNYINRILGLEPTYKTFQVIRFEAIGFGMDNLSPTEGDKRFVPTSWRANPIGSWDAPPYKAYFSIANPGFYKLQVNFQEECYDHGSWKPLLLNDCVEQTFIITPIK
mgnify:CR=1 FL=1